MSKSKTKQRSKKGMGAMKQVKAKKANEVLSERYYSYKNSGTKFPSGVFVGFFDEEAKIVRTGFSRCNFASGDKFNMEIGIAFAVQQAMFQNTFLKDKPENQDFWDHYVNFIDRSNRYFRQNLADVPENQKTAFDLLNRMKNLPLGTIGVGLADQKGLKKLKKMFPTLPVGSVKLSDTSSSKEDYAQADKMLSEISGMFKSLGYSSEQVIPLITAMGVADKEGIELLKKHFPSMDFSKIIEV